MVNPLLKKQLKRLIEAAYGIQREGKKLVVVIDEAHLLEMDTLRRLRLVFDDFTAI